MSQIFSLLQFESKVNCRYKMSKNAGAFGKQKRPTVHGPKKCTPQASSALPEPCRDREPL